MVRALDREQSAKSANLRKMFDIPGPQVQSMFLENVNTGDEDSIVDEKFHSARVGDGVNDYQHIGSPFNHEKGPRKDENGDKTPPSRESRTPSDMDLMKERFAKLLLGEDMSGGGKGVSSALALSNAITNLAASVFGEQKRLEPMSPERKARWRREIDWFLSVTDHIVEFVPSQQSKGGISMEIMTTRQRNDLLMNIPALRKLDAILVDLLDQFGNQTEFWYVSRNDDKEQGTPPRNDDKWWIPTAKVPETGLSNAMRRWLQFQKDSVNQVLKAAMAINAQVLSEMEIPENYIESLPKNGKTSLGDSIYKNITTDYFGPEEFLSSMDLSTEHKVLDLKNRIEASIIIWRRKMHQNQKEGIGIGKSAWGGGVSLEKRELFEERAETILIMLKQRFPGISQSSLDISKIQYNRDVGQAILESYSRVIESLAYTILSRIEDVLYADSMTQTPRSESNDKSSDEEVEKLTPAETPTSKTLLDFMGWSVDHGDTCVTKNSSVGNVDSYLKGEDKIKVKPIATPKKYSYLEKLENLSGLRSPTARH